MVEASVSCARSPSASKNADLARACDFFFEASGRVDWPLTGTSGVATRKSHPRDC
jgi:hypothetical protein